MSEAPRFPLEAVAALFLERQHLRRPRAVSFSSRRLVRLAADTGGLQIDSINVIDRAHYLTVWSRFGVYDRRALDRLTYGRRQLFEYWAHAACFVATDHFPSWRRAMLDYHTRSRGWARWLRKNRATLASVERAIASGGPLGSADFAHRRRPGESGWWNWKPAAHALDYLWMSGRTLVHSRKNFQKRFDLAERLMPEALAAAPLTAEGFQRWHLRRSFHAMGAATEADLRMYLTFPRVGAGERRRWLRHLLDAGEVVPIHVEGPAGRESRATWYALADDLSALAAAGRRREAARGEAGDRSLGRAAAVECDDGFAPQAARGFGHQQHRAGGAMEEACAGDGGPSAPVGSAGRGGRVGSRQADGQSLQHSFRRCRQRLGSRRLRHDRALE